MRGYTPGAGAPPPAILVPRFASVRQTQDASRNNSAWAQMGQMTLSITPQAVGSRFLVIWQATITVTNSGFRGFFRLLDDAAVIENCSIVGWNVNSPVQAGFAVETPAVVDLDPHTFKIEWATGIAPAAPTTVNCLKATDPNMYASWLSALELLPST